MRYLTILRCLGGLRLLNKIQVSEVLVSGIRAQPGMPTEEVREAQLSGPNMSWIIKAKEESSSWPVWETMSDTKHCGLCGIS